MSRRVGLRYFSAGLVLGLGALLPLPDLRLDPVDATGEAGIGPVISQ